MAYTIGVTIFLTPKQTKVETLVDRFDTIEEARLYGAGIMVTANTLGKDAEYRIIEDGRGTIERGNSATLLYEAARNGREERQPEPVEEPEAKCYCGATASHVIEVSGSYSHTCFACAKELKREARRNGVYAEYSRIPA